MKKHLGRWAGANRKTALGVLTAVSLALTASCGGDANETAGGLEGDPIKIGLLTDLTGSAAEVGKYDRQWTELYADRVNADGGIDGRPIEFVVYDTKLDPATAASGARRLIERDGVVAIACCISSSEALQVASVGKELGVASVGGAIVGALTDENEAHYGGYFRVLPGEHDTAGFNVDFAEQQGWSTAAVSHSNLTYGTSGLEIFKSLAPDSGIEIVREVPIAPDATEGSAQAAVIQRENPDGVLMWDYPAPTAIMVKSLRDSGYEGQIVANWSALNDQFWATVGTSVTNVFAHDAYDPENPRSQEIIDAYDAEFGQRPWSVHQLMMSAFIETILAGVEHASENGSEVTGEAVAEGILAQQCLETTLGPEDSCLTFGRPYEDASGVNPYHGGNTDMMLMKTTENGEFVVHQP